MPNITNLAKTIPRKRKNKTVRKQLPQQQNVVYLNKNYTSICSFDYPLKIRIVNKDGKQLESEKISVRLELLKIPYEIFDKFTVLIDYPNFKNFSDTVECQSSGSFSVIKFN